MKIKNLFIFNSDSFWVVLKLSKTTLPFSHLFGSGLSEHSNPIPTSLKANCVHYYVQKNEHDLNKKFNPYLSQTCRLYVVSLGS